MPGYLQKEWVQDGRRYFHYKADAPMMGGIFSANSARYAIRRDQWNDVKPGNLLPAQATNSISTA